MTILIYAFALGFILGALIFKAMNDAINEVIGRMNTLYKEANGEIRHTQNLISGLASVLGYERTIGTIGTGCWVGYGYQWSKKVTKQAAASKRK